MRRVLIIGLTLILLCSCTGSQGLDVAEEIRVFFSQTQSVTMTASVTADYCQRAYVFKLRYQCDTNGGVVEVVEPENIAGITARSDGKTTAIEFDGVILDTGDLDSAGLSPMNCLPLMLIAWRNGHIEEVLGGSDGDRDTVSVTYTVSDGIQVTTVFDIETLLPINAQAIVEGYTAIFADFENVTCG